jgi:hypothetical protein
VGLTAGEKFGQPSFWAVVVSYDVLGGAIAFHQVIQNLGTGGTVSLVCVATVRV